MYALTKTNTASRKRNSDPFAILARDFLGFDPFTASANSSKRSHSPKFDVLENEDSYILKGDLPGISEENVDITVHEGILTIAGTREEESTETTDEFLVRERSSGAFTRQLKLAKDADSGQISAKLEHGVLTLTIAKRPEAKARKIQIGQ